MQVNVYGAFHVLQRVLRHMQEPRSGKVVNIASTAGKWGSMNQSAYNASKHAVVGLTRCAALEMGAHGINVNAICPGFVQTDMLESFRAHGDILGVPFEKVMEAGLARVPLKRFLQPREIADLAVYLGSAESDGMTGQTLLLDGGMLMVWYKIAAKSTASASVSGEKRLRLQPNFAHAGRQRDSQLRSA
jgi:meso-butanediol dehydrogenase/(S,S)-butanediol dehydrogenase/diacetyl reductase